jgi:hypothetical protein
MATPKRRSLIRKPQQRKQDVLDALDAIEFGSDLDGFVDDDDSDEYEDDDEVLESTLQVHGNTGGYIAAGEGSMPIDASVMDDVTGEQGGHAHGQWDEVPQDPGDIDALFGTPVSVRRSVSEADEVTEVASPPERMPDLPSAYTGAPVVQSQGQVDLPKPPVQRREAHDDAQVLGGKTSWLAALGMSIGIVAGGLVLVVMLFWVLSSMRDSQLAELSAAPTHEQPPIAAPVTVEPVEEEPAIEEVAPEEAVAAPVRRVGTPAPAPIPAAAPEPPPPIWDGAPDYEPVAAPEPEVVPVEADKKGLFKKKKK